MKVDIWRSVHLHYDVWDWVDPTHTATKKVPSNEYEWYTALMIFWAEVWAKLADEAEKSGYNAFYQARVG